MLTLHDIQKQCYCQDTDKEMLPWSRDIRSSPKEHTVVYCGTARPQIQSRLFQCERPQHTTLLSLSVWDLVSKSSFVIYAVAIFILFKSFMIAWVNLPLFQLAITIPTIHWQLWNERVSSPMSRIPHRKAELDMYHLSHVPFHLCACRCVRLWNEWLSEIKWNPCVQTFLASLC